jgi:hypothetical protein
MHPLDDSGDAFFKQQCATCIRASIEMIVSFPGAQAIGAFVVQYILDASHISTSCTNPDALFGQPNLKHIWL